MYNYVENADRDYDVIIVGGGFSGANAARTLTQQGKRVLVLEGRNRLAGRTWFEADFFGKGLPIEWGGAFMLDRATFPSVWKEIDEHGLRLAWGSVEQTDLVWRSAGELRTSMWPVPLASLGDFERSVALVDAAARGIDTTVPLSAQDIGHLDVSYRDFFERHGFDQHTTDIWRAQAITVAGDDWEVPSILPLLVSVAHAGSFAASFFVDAPYKTPVASTLGPQLADGTISLFEAVFSGSTADVLLNTRVNKVIKHGESVTLETSAGTLTAPAVIVAVGLSVLGGIKFEPPLAPEHARLAAEGVSGQAEKVTALISNCSTPFYAHGIPEAPGFAALSSTWQEGNQAIVVGFTTKAGALDPNDVHQVQAAVREFLPDAIVEKTAGHDWTGDDLARGTWSYYRPGQMAQALEVSELSGNLAFASSDYQRSMGIEGALQSGKRAAQQVLGALAE